MATPRPSRSNIPGELISMRILDYRSPDPEPRPLWKDRVAERIGYAALTCAFFGGWAALLGLAAIVCAIFSRNEFLDPCGIAGSLLLLACWASGGIAVLAGLVGLGGPHRKYAGRLLLACIAVVGVATLICLVIFQSHPQIGGAPGGF